MSSKTVRLKDHLVAEVERLAKEERRSLTNMVEILLEQALRMDEQPITKETVTRISRHGVVIAQTPTTPRAEADTHFKPDFKK